MDITLCWGPMSFNVYNNTRRPCYMSERLITVPFERSEPFHLLRMMGVSVPSLHIEW